MGQVRNLDEARPARARTQAKATASPEARAQFALAKAINKMDERFGPAADAIVSLDKRLDALCEWLKKRGPWVLASVPVVYSMMAGGSEATAKWLGAFIKAWAG